MGKGVKGNGYSGKGCQKGVGIVEKGVRREWVEWERVVEGMGEVGEYSGKG